MRSTSQLQLWAAFVSALDCGLRWPLSCHQVYLGDADWAGDEGEDPLGDVICMECGQGDDEDNLMLCDGMQVADAIA